MKVQITILSLIFSLFFYTAAFSKEEIKKTETELRAEFKEEIKKAKKNKNNEEDIAVALELFKDCKEKKTFKILIKYLSLKKDRITIAVLNVFGSCDDSTKIPQKYLVQELKKNNNNIIVRYVAAKGLSKRTLKSNALSALFACIKSLNLSDKKGKPIVRTPDKAPAQEDNTENNDAQNQANESLQQVIDNIESANNNKRIDPNISISKLDAALLLADACMKSIHVITKEKQHIIKKDGNGSSVTWWNEDKNKNKAGKWWKKNKQKFQKADAKYLKELKAKRKKEKEEEEKKKAN